MLYSPSFDDEWALNKKQLYAFGLCGISYTCSILGSFNIEIASSKVNTLFVKAMFLHTRRTADHVSGALFRKLSALIRISGTEPRAFRVDLHASTFHTDPQLIRTDPHFRLALKSLLLTPMRTDDDWSRELL